MTVTSDARAQAVKLARATLLDPTHITGPRDPETAVGPEMRALGGEFVGYDAREDARLAMVQFQQGLHGRKPIPFWLYDSITAAHRDVTIESLRRVERGLRAYAEKELDDFAVRQGALRLADDLQFHMGALGSWVASAGACSLAVQAFHAALRAGHHAKAWLALRVAITTSVAATMDFDDAGYVPEPIAPGLSEWNDLIPLLARSFGIVAEAQAQIDDEDAILRGGAGQSAPVDFGSLDLDPWTSSRQAQAEPQKAAPPTHVVLRAGALDHLPGSSSSGTTPATRSSTPRGEFNGLVGQALPLVHGIDVVAVGRKLDAQFPWFRDLTALLLRDLAGGRFAKLRNTLAVSPPGSGKTSYLRAFCEAAGIPCVLYNAAGVADAAFGGTSRQWSTGRASVPLQTIQRLRVANPVIIIDEIEKAGTRSENGRLTDSLTALLEPAGSRAFHEVYLETECDLSPVQYLATANSTSGIPGPLLDRLRIVHVGLPRLEDLPIAAANLVAEIREERGLDGDWLPDLDGDELQLLARVWTGGSLRPLRRAVTALLDGRDQLARRH